ncbi:unnamed protein product [Cuscuta campestris]|uniref:Uncharacterized protein n=1 Tax=Cuscuta campestris TaxID=132261 RepID=A0A484MRP9_9ASTE|nr:unnamed protein product [Cuscuta campestris]
MVNITSREGDQARGTRGGRQFGTESRIRDLRHERSTTRQQSNRRRLSSSTRTAGGRLSSSISIWTQSRAGVVGLHRPSASSEAWRSGSDLSDSGRKSYGGLLSDSIFVGGISEVISSDMLMEIAKSFGHLKAYHFEFNADLNEPRAFLEVSSYYSFIG